MSTASYLLKNINRLLALVGVELHKQVAPRADAELPYDFSDTVKAIVQRVQPFTMTSPERIATLIDATTHLVRNGIPGDFVECGVWRGGSAMTMALTLQQYGISDRRLWLYDTFEGMSAPTAADVSHDGENAAAQLATQAKDDARSIWCFASKEDVQHNVRSTGYPEARLSFVQGRVEDTIPHTAPDQIALLRLDTDWYESTKHELTHLYPRLAPGGVLIIDDYGYWQGARKAVDEYFAEHDTNIFFARVDSTARVATKPWRAA